MLKKALPILFALATANSITAAYAEDLAERRQLARDYLTVVATEAKIMRSVEASRTSFYQLLQENQPALYAEKRAKIEAIINEMLQQVIEDTLEGTEISIAETFTASEIRALNAFVTSPDGKAVIEKLPQLNRARGPQLQAMIKNRLPVLFRKLADEGVQIGQN